VTFYSAAARVFSGPKKGFLSLQTLISLGKISALGRATSFDLLGCK